METIQISFTIIIAVVTFALGAITKIFVEAVPDRFIPLQNLLVGLIAGLIGFYMFNLYETVWTALIWSIFTCMGAGGIYDLIQTNKKV